MQLSRCLLPALLGAILLASATTQLHAQRLTVRIEGIRSTEGLLHVGFYDSAEQWHSEKSNFQRHGDKTEIQDGIVTIIFDDVPPGHYAAALVDDENGNGHIDWGIIVPKEGFGFSNYEHRGLFRPKFEDFDFVLEADKDLTIVMKVRYI